MPTQRPTILLTGFGAFPGVGKNATAALVPALAAGARARFPDFDVIDEVLPVEWGRTPQLLQQLLSRTSPRLALHFGVTRHASGFQIERIGRNVCEPRHDAAGAIPDVACLIADGPETLSSTFPVERIIARLEGAGLPCAMSDSAGTYLCNATLYHSLTIAQTRPTASLAGFVHLPADLAPGMPAVGASRISWDDALVGSIEIIAACLEQETSA
ncbi:pyroglutamyl-peptidase [Hyphomicrobium sp. 1Nfss2.1]|uniref:pyroglutamyl-peptidase I family protein n=1 Tax=Hyphomicrobium sp. 1Nfss2.1 TaxID=3413936 RepID=UPI003C7E2FB8